LKEIIIIAGPNGAGKTSFARSFLGADQKIRFLNADEIAQKTDKKLEQQKRDILAGREILKSLDKLTANGESLMVETTLSGLTHARKIPIWRAMGYHITLIYLKLPAVEHAIERVRQRVRNGGHDIPPETIRRRFDKSLILLDDLYKPIVDEWYIYEWTAQAGEKPGFVLTETGPQARPGME